LSAALEEAFACAPACALAALEVARSALVAPLLLAPALLLLVPASTGAEARERVATAGAVGIAGVDAAGAARGSVFKRLPAALEAAFACAIACALTVSLAARSALVAPLLLAPALLLLAPASTEAEVRARVAATGAVTIAGASAAAAWGPDFALFAGTADAAGWGFVLRTRWRVLNFSASSSSLSCGMGQYKRQRIKTDAREENCYLLSALLAGLRVRL
jgi:hypothetical protein